MKARKMVGRSHDLYLDLINRFPLRPIRSEEELDEATEIIDALIDRVEDLDPSD
jgi:HTH-type transcriptional regulator / antitoxin HigA